MNRNERVHGTGKGKDDRTKSIRGDKDEDVVGRERRMRRISGRRR